MDKIEVYYDYFEGLLCPQWMIIYFGNRQINWNEKYVYIPLDAPFKRKLPEEYMDFEMAFTITQVDLLMNVRKENHLGIDLQRVVSRLNKMRGEGKFPYDINDISIFVLQIADIEEVLAMDINELFAWR